MNSPLPLRVVSSAARAIAEAADWWAANRPKAPDAFVTDLEKALKLKGADGILRGSRDF